ncbi:carboxypeptidase-like regulatory domain-containing protein [Hymenobacter coccineus]|uniref:carboxypeptidase-like regulatory domain-containing protein n=1 Tax=Hymenobacter coccineus TaxID=1908235 RepID=UPI0009F3E34C|nr:carboxypeptidase-like regulatory domain-containing protein [Hymenobacter coccineus]
MDRVLFLFAALILAFTSAAQSYLLSGQVIDSDTNTGVPGVTVLLKLEATIIAGCGTNQNGDFQLTKAAVTDYAIEVKCPGYQSKTLIFIGLASNPAPLRILMPGFCPYTYTRGKIPLCIGGHTDQIVPIFYGLPPARIMEKAKKTNHIWVGVKSQIVTLSITV